MKAATQNLAFPLFTDNVSWRRANGSLFIIQLINYIQKYSRHFHLTKVFVMVSSILSAIVFIYS